MAKLEDLVPPLELCKRIHKGKFDESVLVWRCYGSDNPMYDPKDCLVERRDFAESDYIVAPAPTLAEILAEIANGCYYCPTAYYQSDEWHVECESDDDRLPCVHDAEDSTAATAALKLWLELNGKGARM